MRLRLPAKVISSRLRIIAKDVDTEARTKGLSCLTMFS